MKKSTSRAFSHVNGKAGVVLTIVALLELILILGAVTYGWIEETSMLDIKTANLNVESGVNEVLKISQAQEADNNGYIDLKSYFKRSANMQLARTSSVDGKIFYFNTNQPNTYRLGDIDDVNTSYIAFEIEVEALAGDTKFWFDGLPQITIDDDAALSQAVRLAVSDGESTKIFKLGSGQTNAVNGVSSKAAQPTEQFSQYVFDENNINDNVLFSMDAGQTKKFSFTLWIEAEDDQSEAALGKTLSVDIKLCTSWSKYTEISFVDQTVQMDEANPTTTTISHWLEKNNAVLCLVNGNANGNDVTGYRYEMKKSENFETDYTWTGYVPIGVTNIQFARVKAPADSGGIDLQQTDLWNYWKPAARGDETQFVALWHDFGSTDGLDSKLGMGFWGEYEKIEFKLLPSHESNEQIRIKFGSTKDTWALMHKLTDGVTYSGVIPTAWDSVDFILHSKTGSYWSTDNSIIWNGNQRDNRTVYYAYGKGESRGTWNKMLKIKGMSSPETVGRVDILPNGENAFLYTSALNNTEAYVVEGATVQLKATATNSNYSFSLWEDISSTENPRDITVGSENSYYTAQFTRTKTTITGKANKTYAGTVTANGSSSATVNIGQTVTLQATPKASYEFLYWEDDQTNTNPQRTVTAGGQDAAYTAVFKTKIRLNTAWSGDTWNKASAWFVAFYRTQGGGSAWVKLERESSSSNYFAAYVDDADFTSTWSDNTVAYDANTKNLFFFRMPNTTQTFTTPNSGFWSRCVTIYQNGKTCNITGWGSDDWWSSWSWS